MGWGGVWKTSTVLLFCPSVLVFTIPLMSLSCLSPIFHCMSCAVFDTHSRISYLGLYYEGFTLALLDHNFVLLVLDQAIATIQYVNWKEGRASKSALVHISIGEGTNLKYWALTSISLLHATKESHNKVSSLYETRDSPALAYLQHIHNP